MKQLLIPIQSFSNIITNSSSEIFCIIKGDKETILFINNLLFNLLGKNVYDEDSPMYELLCKSDLDKDDYDEENLFRPRGPCPARLPARSFGRSLRAEYQSARRRVADRGDGRIS